MGGEYPVVGRFPFKVFPDLAAGLVNYHELGTSGSSNRCLEKNEDHHQKPLREKRARKRKGKRRRRRRMDREPFNANEVLH